MKCMLICFFVFNFVFCIIGDTTNRVEKLTRVMPHTRSLAAESFFWEGFRITSEIRDEDIIGTPAWSTDGKTVLPLAPERAAMLAREKLGLYLEGTNTCSVSSILLRKYMETNYWFYRIGFVRSSETERGTSPKRSGWPFDQEEFRLFVLMSGRVIKPEIDKFKQP